MEQDTLLIVLAIVLIVVTLSLMLFAPCDILAYLPVKDIPGRCIPSMFP